MQCHCLYLHAVKNKEFNRKEKMFLSVHILRTCVEFRGCSFKQTKLIASPQKCRQYFAKPVARKVKKNKKK